MRTFIAHDGQTLTVDFRVNERRNVITWSLTVCRGTKSVPLMGAFSVLPLDKENAEELVKAAASRGLVWLGKRTGEEDSVGRGHGYSVAAARSPPLFEARGVGHMAEAFH